MSSSAQKFERHAVVIGGGMAGLLAARVLSDRFTHVSLLERDTYPAEPVFRPGVPQGRHVHLLLLRGQLILEELFPGFKQRIIEQGAVPIDMLADYAIRYPSGWLTRTPRSIPLYSCTRTLLEWQVRRDLLRSTSVEIIEGHEAISLRLDKAGQAITGVQIRKRGADALTDDQATQELAADLVVDASGRESRISGWLLELGFPVPEETVLNPFLGYSSCLCKLAPDARRTWSGIIMSADPPHVLRGGLLAPIEGDRWQLVVVGMSKDYPPTEPDAFREFARGMLDHTLYEVLKDAELLSPIYGYRKTENRWRHFERLKRQPEGLLVLGDAACAFDPVYGQGMSVAAMGALALRDCLTRHTQSDLTGLARRFQRALAHINQTPWQLSIGADYKALPVEEQTRSWLSNTVNRYFERLTNRLPSSVFLSIAFSEVTNLVKPPTSLFRPAIIWKVLTTRVTKSVEPASVETLTEPSLTNS